MSSLVYLCGPITGLTYEEARMGWRKDVSIDLGKAGITCLSPMRGKDHLRKQDTMAAEGYASSVMSNAKGITARDRYDTQRCDLVFCNLFGASPRVSIGSMIELGWADSRRIPIVLVMEPGNVHDHAMVRETADFIVNTVDEGVRVTRAILVPGI